MIFVDDISHLSRSHLVCLFALISGLFCLCFSAHGQNPTSSSDLVLNDEARFLYSSIWVERDKIRQAQCIITEFQLLENDVRKMLQVQKFTFDEDSNSWKAETEDKVEPGNSFTWIQKGDQVVHYFPANDFVGIRPPTDARPDIRPATLIDPRSLGISPRHEIHQMTYPEYKSAIIKILLNGNYIFSAEKNPDGQEFLLMKSDKYKVSRSILLTPELSYSSPQTEIFYEMDNFDGPAWSIKTEWKKISEIFVPVSCIINNSRDREIYAIEVDWLSINEPISPAEFQWDELLIPQGTKIVDASMGHDQPASISNFGEKEQHSLPQKRSHLIWYLVAANILVLLVLIIAFIASRRK